MLKECAINPDCLKFQAVIKKNMGNKVILKRSFFYPESGGQLSDRGTIDGIYVKKVEIDNDYIIHFLSQELKKEAGESVECVIDEKIRREHSRQHSGQHLLSGILLKDYGIYTKSFRMGERYSSIDIESKELPSLKELEDKIMSAIAESRPVKAEVYEDLEFMDGMSLRKVPSVSKNVRVMTITGYDCTPCGGTHVKNTGELKIVKLLKGEKYKKGYRLEFVYGDRAYSLFQREHMTLMDLSKLFSSPIEEVGTKVEEFHRRYLELKKKSDILLEKEFINKIKDLSKETSDSSPPVLIKKEDVEAESLSKAVSALIDEWSGFVLLYNSKGGFCAGAPENLNIDLKDKLTPFIKGGGGTPTLMRGKIRDDFSEEKLRNQF